MKRLILFTSCRRTLYEAMTPKATSHTYTVSLVTSSDIVLSAIHKFDSLNNKAKRAICKRCRRSRNKVLNVVAAYEKWRREP